MARVRTRSDSPIRTTGNSACWTQSARENYPGPDQFYTPFEEQIVEGQGVSTGGGARAYLVKPVDHERWISGFSPDSFVVQTNSLPTW